MNHIIVIVCLFFGFLLIALSLSSYLKKTSYKEKYKWESFIYSEHQADFITKKTFPSHLVLTYENNPILDFHTPECQCLYNSLLSLHDKPMVNLSGYTNLELKETFGINHFQTLVQYEDNFIRYVATLNRYVKDLQLYGYHQEAIQLISYMTKNNLL